jgi:long-chain fatty acid transport protein
MAGSRPRSLGILSLTSLAIFAIESRAQAQGLVLPAAGAINRSMAGTAVAAPLDTAGAVYWNPATLAALPDAEMELSTAAAYAATRVSSALPAGAFAPGVPPAPLYGQTHNHSGVALLPVTALSYRPEESRWTFAFGGFAAGGFFNNYPSNPGNPIISPRPPLGFGSGPVLTSVGFSQFATVAALQLTDRLAVGFGPTVTASVIQVDPFFFAAPDDVNGDGRPSYPVGSHTRVYWGLGWQAGIYYRLESGWNFGMSYKSRQWMQTAEYQSADELGFPRILQLHVDFPRIYSIGASYTGLERFLFAVDLRWIDFDHTPGFKETAGFDGNGRITGAGWRSVWVVAFGTEYQLTDSLRVRAGYLVNRNPIPDENAFFNAASASIYEHSLFFGASYQFTEALKISLGWGHALHNGITGPYHTPAGPVPGSMVRMDQHSDALDIAFSVRY